MRNTTALALVAGVLMAASQAQAGSFTFTNDADWDRGSYKSTNSGPPGLDNQIQLDPNVVTRFDHIWVALSGRGTAVRIDTNFDDPNGVVEVGEYADGGPIFGEYRTAPSGRGTNPSRTTVDNNGDVWVGNRDEANGGLGSVVKISASPAGTTSTGVWNGSTFDALDWTNAGGADNNGGVSTAADTAIERYVRTAGASARSIAVDANNDVWVGGYGNKVHQRIDGATGATDPGFSLSPGGYGALIDADGVLWSSGWSTNRIARYDTVNGVRLSDAISGGSSYGLGVDSQGNIWNSHLSNRVSKLDKDGNLIATYTSGGSGGRGVAVTADDNVWVANSSSSSVSRFANDGTLLATIGVGATPTGVSVDSNGKVWVTNQSNNNATGNSVMRIDPATNQVDLTVRLGSNAAPYNYSDMTGSVVGGITNPTGEWSIVFDGGADLETWDKILWNTEAEGSIPIGTGIKVELRTADTEGGLGSAGWMAYDSGDMLGLMGQWIEVRATLTRTGGVGAESPILSDLTLLTSTSQIPLPASWLLLASGVAGISALRRKAGKA
jgi:streptogramin lyase